MPGSVEIILRTLTAFLLLWLFVHQLGKQVIAQKTYHLYIASITVGTIAGNLAFNIKIKFLYFIISFVMMAVVVFILNILTIRNRRYRKWIAGNPTTLIENGKILEETMQKLGYSLDSLMQALRGKDIFNLGEVECAILEIDGSLSVLKKSEFQNITKQDLHIVSPPSKIPLELIMEGQIIHENLSKNRDQEDWLMRELKKRDLQVNEITYAVVGTNGSLYIDLFEDHLRKN